MRADQSSENSALNTATEEIEARHRKKSKSSSTSLSSHRSSHKHSYEKAILIDRFFVSWGDVCSICGKVGPRKDFFGHSRDFLRDPSRGLYYSEDAYLSAAEIHAKYPEYRIFETDFFKNAKEIVFFG